MSATLIGMAPATASKPCGKVFETTLTNITKARPRVPVDTWTEADAAQFWIHDHDSTDINAVPPQIITAIVARLFVSYYRRVVPMARFFRVWMDEAVNGFPCQRLHRHDRTVFLDWAFVANVAHAGRKSSDLTDSTHCRGTGIEYIAESSIGYCHRKSCKHRDSMLRGCLFESAYLKLLQSGYLVPWSSVNWGGFATLFTPLRHCVRSPIISVRKERSHERKAVVPYWVADTFNNLHRIVPGLMMSHDFRSLVSRDLRTHVEAVFTERFRFSGVQSMSADYAEVMQRWDALWSIAAWDFVKTESPYCNDSYDVSEELMIDRETCETLDQTCCSVDSLFHAISSKSDE